MDARDPFPRRTATPGALAPWIPELARTLPGLISSYRNNQTLDARTRERVILAVTEVNGCRYCAWIHGNWAEFLGPGRERGDVEEHLLTYARACAEAGRPLDPAPLIDKGVPADVVRAVRATVAQMEVSNLVGNTVDGFIARLTRKRPLDLLGAAQELSVIGLAVPVALPLIGAGAVLKALERMAPPLPEVGMPAKGEANLLVHLVAAAIPTYLSNALVRLLVLGIPLDIAFAIKAGRTPATIRIGRGRVRVENGVADDALFMVEGDVEPLLRIAAGSVVGEVRKLRVRPPT